MISVTYTCVRGIFIIYWRDTVDTNLIVKHIIAWSNILPWSKFWRSSAPIRSKEPKDAIEMQTLISRTTDDTGKDVHTLRTGTPQGGIALHWIACVFYISVSSAIYLHRKRSPGLDDDTIKKFEQEEQSVILEAISFPGLLNTYSHSCVGG